MWAGRLVLAAQAPPLHRLSPRCRHGFVPRCSPARCVPKRHVASVPRDPAPPVAARRSVGNQINFARVSTRAGLLLMAASAAYWVFLREMELQEELRLERQAAGSTTSSDASGGAAATTTATAGAALVGGPFDLISHTGAPLSDTAFRGRFMLVYFGFSNCPDICPEEMDKMGDALASVPPDLRNMVVPVFVTCDPERDDPPTVRAYLQEFHPDFVGLTGTTDQIAALARAYRVYYKPAPRPKGVTDYLVDHSIYIFLMNPDGGFCELYNRSKTSDTIAAGLADHVRTWLKEHPDSAVPKDRFQAPEPAPSKP